MAAYLTELLRDASLAPSLSGEAWSEVVSQARRSRLAGGLYSHLEAAGQLDAVPAPVLRHLASDWVVYLKQRQSLQFELGKLQAALAEAGEELLLLKGAAYQVAGLALARGRLISDIDILVRKEKLAEVEAALRRHGWTAGNIHPYNDRYYRQWMHEIPPLAHAERQSTLDVHHTILPPTAGASIDADDLWRDAVECGPGIFVLSPLDRVLHSATHLFHEGEFDHGLRDLRDLDLLLRHCQQERGDAFFTELVARARHMGLEIPLYYALRYTGMMLGTPVPEGLADALLPAPPAARLWLMDFLFRRAFTPPHSSCALPLSAVAGFGLYVRSHYLRMPLRLLLPHLLRKAWMERFPGEIPDPDRVDHDVAA